MSPNKKLIIIKIVHTLVWVFFASCILAIPFTTAFGHLKTSTILIAVTMIEVSILLMNRMRCPLLDLATHYVEPDQRRPGFDIYLPAWLAEHTKSIFGTIFVVGVLFTAVAWIKTLI